MQSQEPGERTSCNSLARSLGVLVTEVRSYPNRIEPHLYMVRRGFECVAHAEVRLAVDGRQLLFVLPFLERGVFVNSILTDESV